MRPDYDNTASSPSLESLYPQLGPEELEDARDRLDRYLALALAIYEDILGDPARHRELRTLLTEIREKRNTPKE